MEGSAGMKYWIYFKCYQWNILFYLHLSSAAIIIEATVAHFSSEKEVHYGPYVLKRFEKKLARAASVLITQSCFTPFEKWNQVFNGLDGLKGLP